MIKKYLKIAGWVVGVVFGLVIIIVAFNYTFIRPGNIKQACDTSARQAATKIAQPYDSWAISKSKYDFQYTSCLRQHGI